MTFRPTLNRALRPAVAVGASLSLLVGGALVAAPAVSAAPVAQAAAKVATKKPAAPTLRVVPGAKQATATWSKVAGAKKYVVQYSTTKSFKKKKTKSVTTRTTTATIKKLKLRTDYWVRVTATTSAGKVTSKKVKVRATTAPVGRTSITVKPAGPNQVKVSWKPLKKGTKITIVGSYDNDALKKSATRFSVSGIKATETSRVVTVPASFRKYVGATTANPVYIQANMFNGTRKSTSPIAYSVVGRPAAPASNAPTLTFATYNVGSIAATKERSARTWEKRRTAVARAITTAAPDVITVQETTTAKSAEGVRQYDDLVGRLPSRYRLVYTADTIGTAKGAATKGDHVIVNTDRVAVVKSGVQSLSALLPANQRNDKDRFFGWARLKDRKTGKTFSVVSIHLQNGASSAAQKHRLDAIKAIESFAAKKIVGSASEPLVFAGDFNSDVARYPSGPPTYLSTRGFVDAAAAPTTRGMEWATTNNQNATKDGGYPTSPAKYKYSATRIDYILVKNGKGSTTFTNQVILTGGKFDERYRGSDHNLQVAKLRLS
ncbi:endonuclease/exonuclease/phosphatase family metal-dependent hydrolase [Flavimobilis soli]|uniref:Endonuclease/exonuclease/phosphatase family metal-dependent hydrolase n=1 Tax=Flavimobilis soli TaxID=442709 RepID=A0A2A9EF02_9MICO|nr:endonuclease/exonuclease/phosphatase family protein [Flavimobilis soli]PFG37617.1 endonuclease/exonuclease/phosphatase family metal-dependent hydrolase [Flavimobilis soli]